MRWCLSLVVLLAIGLAVAVSPAAARRPLVVVIVFDEFPADSLLRPDGRIDSVRYPGFGRLARLSNWFPNAFSVQDQTSVAVPAILDGRFPRRGTRPTFADHPLNLFTLLSSRGYRVDAIEPFSTLCPPTVCPDSLLGGPGPPPFFLSKRVMRFRDALQSIRRTRRPLLLFHHQILPHQPWEFLPSGRRYRHDPEPWDRGLSSSFGFHDVFLTNQNQQRHLLQVGFVDREIDQLLDRLKRVGLLRQALLVVTADHGIGFDVGVSDRRSISPGNIAEVAPVPLFVKRPGQSEGRVDRTFVHTVDVVPTIGDLLNLGRLWPMEGRSAFRRRGHHEVRVPKLDLSGWVSIGPRALAKARAVNRSHQARLFGTGSDSLYRIGPNRRLLGRSLADLAIESASASTTGFVPEFEFRASTGHSPTWFTGTLVSDDNPGAMRDLALAVNGRVTAVARTFRLRGEPAERFSLMVPEAELRPGRNDAALFVVEGGRLLRLEPDG